MARVVAAAPGVTAMLSLSARLATVALALASTTSAPSAQNEDPVYDGKKASAWSDILRNDKSARQRTLAVTALAGAWGQFKHHSSVVDIGRSLRTDSSPAVRARCAAAVAALNAEGAKAVEIDVVNALKDEKEARVRLEIVVALGRHPDVAKKAVGPLADVLKDADPVARTAAADALAKVGPPAAAAAPALVPLLDDMNKAARQSAIFALGRISPENPSFVAAALVKRFSEEKEADLRRELLVSLKLLGDKSESVVTALAAALDDPDDETRAVAARTLGTFGPVAKPAAAALWKLATESTDKGFRIDAVRAFGSALGTDLKGRLKDVIRMMESDPEFEVRIALVEEIGALGNDIKDDKEAMGALRKRLSDPQGKVREAAAAAIRRIEKKPEKGPDATPEKKP